VLRRIFGPKREDMTGWKNWYDEDFHNFYSSLNIIRAIKIKESEMGGYM
jgi:hypothetical protein